MIEDLERKSSQTSQQLQGEVFELKVEEKLSELFKDDDVQEVKKGARGADVILTVKMPSGRVAGSIVFECKDVKEWNSQWVTKFKKDLRENSHDIGIIVTTAMPKNIESFGNLDGIWVCAPPFFPMLATILRDQLIKVTRATITAETPKDQRDFLFKYMTSHKFTQKIQGVSEQIKSMTETLAVEKRALQKNWKKREQEIESIALYIGGFYGELEGLVGKSLPKLELYELEAPDEE
ncbi:MAG: DUF2130 domain-containing protein [Bdellovibrionaceae bacterium]|nr:DUF2130 domain-containing protein [Pseudobdellovibrionaceae bacterium]